MVISNKKTRVKRSEKRSENKGKSTKKGSRNKENYTKWDKELIDTFPASDPVAKY